MGLDSTFHVRCNRYVGVSYDDNTHDYVDKDQEGPG